MVLQKLVTFIYHLIGLPGQQRLKPAPLCDAFSSDVSGKVVKITGNSPATSNSRDGGEGEVCCVCLSRLKEGESMRILPCLHKFHRVCVDRWFNVYRKTCPLCRFSMGEKEKFQKSEELTEEMRIWFSSFHIAGF